MTVEVETMVTTLMGGDGHLNLRASSAPTPLTLTSSSLPSSSSSPLPSSAPSSTPSSSSSSPSPSASHSPSSEPLLRMREGQRASKRKQTRPIRSIKKTEGDLSHFIVLNFCQSCTLPQDGKCCAADQKEFKDASLDVDDLELTDSEKEFCASIGLSQSNYLKLREAVIKEGPKVVQKPTFKKKVKLDVSKTKRLFEFFSQARFQKSTSPKS